MCTITLIVISSLGLFFHTFALFLFKFPPFLSCCVSLSPVSLRRWQDGFASGNLSSNYNKMSTGQYASGLSARTGTTKSTIKHWIWNTFISFTRMLIWILWSRANVTEMFLDTIGVSESCDSLEVLLSAVSHNTFSHFHLRWMRAPAKISHKTDTPSRTV